MPNDPIQILEVRADQAQQSVAVTAAVSADAGQAIFIALSEQLDRRRALPAAAAEDVLALRQRTELAERFAPLSSARAHAVVALVDHEFRDCLLELSDYRERVDGEHYQPLELRRRLQLIAEIIGVMWDANAAVAAAGEALATRLTS